MSTAEIERSRDNGSGERRLWLWCLVGVLTASFGAAFFYGSLTPRSFPQDEIAHTAYAATIRDGKLPSVDTPLPEAAHSEARGQRLDAQDHIFVANHPPLVPAVWAGLASVLRLEKKYQPELAVGRALNGACMLAAVAAVAGLGWEVTRSLRTGVLAATIFASLPALWSLSTYGYIDGGATLATVLVTWAGVRAWLRRDLPSHLWLGFAIAIAGATSESSLGAAVAIGILVGLHTWIRMRASARTVDERDMRLDEVASTPSTQTSHRLPAMLAAISIPALVLSAWWYVRNWLLFGDPVASTLLNERLHRTPRAGGLLGRLVYFKMWQGMLSDLTTSVYRIALAAPRPRLPMLAAWAIGLLGVAALAGLLLRSTDRAKATRAPLLGWPVLVTAIVALILGISAHTGHGGSGHPRYLLPALAIFSTLAVCGLDRLHPRLAVGAALGLAAASISMLPRAHEWIVQVADDQRMTVLASSGWRIAGLVLLGIGTALALTCACRRTRGASALAP